MAGPYNTLGAFAGIGKETTYGTPVAATGFHELLEGGDTMKLKAGRMAKPNLRCASSLRSVKAKRGVEGGIKIPLFFAGAEQILKYGLGTSNTSALSGSNKSHQFTLLNSLNTALTVRMNRGESATPLTAEFIYQGCKVNKLGFSLQPEGQLELAVDFLGQDETLGAASVPTFTAAPQITWDLLTTKTIGAVDVPFQSFEVNVENNLDGDTWKLGTVNRQEMIRGGARKITGSFEFEFQSLTHYNYFRNETQNAIVLTFDGGVITGADHWLLTLSLPKVNWLGDTPSADKVGPFKQKMNFETEAATENDDLSITLQNQTASIP
jgi:hypothetical protein